MVPSCLSLATVERWAAPCAGFRGHIGEILLRVHGASLIHAGPERKRPTAPTLQHSLGATGVQLRRALLSQPRLASELEVYLKTRHTLQNTEAPKHFWHQGWLNPKHANRFPPFRHSSDRIRDLVEIEWINANQLRFKARTATFPLADKLAKGFRKLCDELVYNYPGLLQLPAQPEDLVLRPPSLDIWTLVPARECFTLQWSPVADVRVPIGEVSSSAEPTHLARRFLHDEEATFDRHPWLDHMLRIWNNESAVNKRTAKTLLLQSTCEKARSKHEGRSQRWRQQDPEIADALDQLQWAEIAHFPGIVDSQRTLLLRLKGDRLSRWDRTRQQAGCPHCPGLGAHGGASGHIFWGCPMAQQLWHTMISIWSFLWSPDQLPGVQEFKVAFFSLRLPSLPNLLWSHPSMDRLPPPTVEATIATHAAVHAAWRQHSLVVMQTIWRWRTAPDQIDDIWTPPHADTVLHNALAASLRDLKWKRTTTSAATPHTATAIRLLRDSSPELVSPLPSRAAVSAQYLLFFDGGSRGNPGPGGSGAVIVRVSTDKTNAEVVFSAASAFADPTTTNNQAEYEGLTVSLHAAAENHWTPLSVIGDSMIIIQQMKHYKPPLNVTLQGKYARARRLADTLGVRNWSHHPRAANKMADAAANLAMDDNASSSARHPTDNQHHTRIASLLPGDLAHWREENTYSLALSRL